MIGPCDIDYSTTGNREYITIYSFTWNSETGVEMFRVRTVRVGVRHVCGLRRWWTILRWYAKAIDEARAWPRPLFT